MKEVYFEIQLPDNKVSYKMRKHFIECFLGENVHIQEDTNPRNGIVLLTAHNNHQRLKIDKTELKILVKNLNTLKPSEHSLHCENDYLSFIETLFKNRHNNFKIIGNMIYYNDNKFFSDFSKKIDRNIVFSHDDLTYVLNLKRISVPTLKINDSPDRLIDKIMENNTKSNYFIAETHEDIINSKRVKESKIPRFFYYHSTLKTKYALLISLLEINKDNNLPTNTVRKIVNNLNLEDRVETFNYHYYKKICKIDKMEDFQYNSFDDINIAMSHVMDLDLMDIRGILIEHKNKYNICYRYKRKVNFVNNYKSNVSRVIGILKNLTSNDYIFEDYPLKELLNIQIKDKIPYDENSDEITDYDMIENKGMNIYNLIGDITDFSMKKFPRFDRKNINLSIDFNFELVETIDTYYSPVITIEGVDFIVDKDFYFPRKIMELRKAFTKLFEKGYFLTDFGIVRYINSGKISKRDVFFPEWFKSDNDIEFKNLLNFISLMTL